MLSLRLHLACSDPAAQPGRLTDVLVGTARLSLPTQSRSIILSDCAGRCQTATDFVLRIASNYSCEATVGRGRYGCLVPRIPIAVILLVAVLLAGCGGSSGSSGSKTTGASSTPASSDRSTYIAQADALCKSANARQQALRKRAKGLTVVKLVPILKQQAGIAASLSTDLGKLTPPVGDAATVGRFVKAVDQLAVYSKAVANSIAANHAFAAKALAGKLSLARQQETLLGQGYGYKTCASGKSY